MSLIYSTNACQIKRVILEKKAAEEGREVKWALLEWQQEVEQ